MFNLTEEISTRGAIYLMNVRYVDLINLARIQIVSLAHPSQTGGICWFRRTEKRLHAAESSTGQVSIEIEADPMIDGFHNGRLMDSRRGDREINSISLGKGHAAWLR